MSHILPTDYVDSTYDIDFETLYARAVARIVVCFSTM